MIRPKRIPLHLAPGSRRGRNRGEQMIEAPSEPERRRVAALAHARHDAIDRADRRIACAEPGVEVAADEQRDIRAIEPAKVEASKKSGKPLPSLHSSLFEPLPEPTLRTGVKAMTAAVLELMKK